MIISRKLLIGATAALAVAAQLGCRDTVHVEAAVPEQTTALTPLPEASAFIDAYRRVGRPRIAVVVNRSLEGATAEAPPAPGAYLRPADERGRPLTPVRDYWGGREPERVRLSDQQPQPRPADQRAYLRPGQYTDAQAASVDLATFEAALEAWLAADRNVSIVSGSTVRRALDAEQRRGLEAGHPEALAGVAREAEVLIHVQARPTRHVAGELEVSFQAAAMNTRDGRLLSRAAVDSAGPIDSTRAERLARALAGGLMEGLTQAWGGGRAAEETPAARPSPQVAPAPERRPPPPAQEETRTTPVAQPTPPKPLDENDLPPEPKVWNLPRLPVPATRPAK